MKARQPFLLALYTLAILTCWLRSGTHKAVAQEGLYGPEYQIAMVHTVPYAQVEAGLTALKLPENNPFFRFGAGGNVTDCPAGRQYVWGVRLYYDAGPFEDAGGWSAEVGLSHNIPEIQDIGPFTLTLDGAARIHSQMVMLDGDGAFWFDCQNPLVNEKVAVTSATALSELPSEVASSIYLDLVVYERIVVEDYSAFASSSLEMAADVFSLPDNPDEKLLSVQWKAVDQAWEYDVEWVFLRKDEVPLGLNDALTYPASPDEAFTMKEPVRVSTPESFYELPLVYPEGKLYLRARAVSRHHAAHSRRVNASWTYYPQAIDLAGFESDKNWQRVAAFAEGGKSKLSVQYMDGALRARQSVVQLNADRNTMVGESFYDREGRQSFGVAPAVTLDRSLGYHEEFNAFSVPNPASPADPAAVGRAPVMPGLLSARHDDGSPDGQTFPGYGFDHGGVYPTPALDSASGASLYYSSNLLSESANAGIHADYVPRAKGFAYAQSFFTRDNSGRVTQSVALGKAFRHSSNPNEPTHTTKTFYGTPTSTELYRLFGRNVGQANRYVKTLTVDPNGQLSVAYYDQAGNVIATALAGEKPSGVEGLRSYVLNPDDEEDGKATVYLNQSNVRDAEEFVSRSESTVLNTLDNTGYTFNYEFVPAKTQHPFDAGQCELCKYDLEIGVVDEFGNPVPFQTVAVFTYGQDDALLSVRATPNWFDDRLGPDGAPIASPPSGEDMGADDIDFGVLGDGDGVFSLKELTQENCAANKKIVVKIETVFARVGNYTISKKLQMTEGNVDAFYDGYASYFETNELIQQIQGEVDASIPPDYCEDWASFCCWSDDPNACQEPFGAGDCGDVEEMLNRVLEMAGEAADTECDRIQSDCQEAGEEPCPCGDFCASIRDSKTFDFLLSAMNLSQQRNAGAGAMPTDGATWAVQAYLDRLLDEVGDTWSTDPFFVSGGVGAAHASNMQGLPAATLEIPLPPNDPNGSAYLEWREILNPETAALTPNERAKVIEHFYRLEDGSYIDPASDYEAYNRRRWSLFKNAYSERKNGYVRTERESAGCSVLSFADGLSDLASDLEGASSADEVETAIDQWMGQYVNTGGGDDALLPEEYMQVSSDYRSYRYVAESLIDFADCGLDRELTPEEFERLNEIVARAIRDYTRPILICKCAFTF